MTVLRKEELVTDKPVYLMRPENGSIVEVFEWKSSEAINQAHENVAVQALWAEFSEVCDYTPLAQLKETYAMFAEFDALEP